MSADPCVPQGQSPTKAHKKQPSEPSDDLDRLDDWREESALLRDKLSITTDELRKERTKREQLQAQLSDALHEIRRLEDQILKMENTQ